MPKLGSSCAVMETEESGESFIAFGLALARVRRVNVNRLVPDPRVVPLAMIVENSAVVASYSSAQYADPTC